MNTSTPATPARTNSVTAAASERFGSGRSVKRLEDDQLLKGQGQYTDDIAAADLAHVFFVRSPYPHARVVSVDVSAALSMPGVLKAVTGADLVQAGVKPFGIMPGFKRADGTPATAPLRHALAVDRVRFVGEPVVAVVALTVAQARNAAEAVLVDYEELPMVVDMNDATAPGAPQICDTAPGNISGEARYGNAAATDAAFAAASHVVKLDLVNQRLSPFALEPRTVMAGFDPATQRLTLRMSSQMPSGIKESVCEALGMAHDKVRVQVGDVGGGFGMKTGIYPEDLMLAFCARSLQRNLKWTAERGEEFLSSTHGRDLQTHAEMALDASGKILALRLASMGNIGAYAAGVGGAIFLMIGPWVQTSVYDIQTIDFHLKTVLTNTAPTAAYRGAGRPEAIFTMERLMDEAARQTGIDRIELRRRNFIQPSQMPYKNPMGQTYDTGNFESVMNQALELAEWSSFEARAAQSAQRGKWRGLGIATFLEWTGGPVLKERVTVSVKPEGIIEVFSAVNAMGQGIATTLAQLVMDSFEVPMEKVRIVLGDTDRGDGFGSVASRSLFTGGSAVSVGAERTLEVARQLAAKELEVAPEDLTYSQAMFKVKGTDLEMDLFSLAGLQNEKQIFMESTSSVAGATWPNGCHISEIELDPQTGKVEVVAYASVNDIGRVINPMIVRGQLDGGAVQAMGQALCEHHRYDRETGQLVTGSLMDYCVPRADIMRGDFKTVMDESTPCKNNALGVKGVGELGTIGATPTVVNAIANALARNGRGDLTRNLQMPLTSSRVWELMQNT